MADRITWTIHPVANTDEGNGPLFALLPSDGTQGIVVGDLPDAIAACLCLRRLTDSQRHDGEIPEFDPRLGHRQLSVREASEEYGVPRASITLACRQGQITDAVKGRYGWRFSENAFRVWMKHRPGRGRR